MNVNWLGVCLGLAFALCGAQKGIAQETGGASKIESDTSAAGISRGSLAFVEIAEGKPWKRIRPGSILEGSLSVPLYSGENVAVPQGTKVRLTVNSVRRAREAVSVWRRAVRLIGAAFNPLEKPHVPQYELKLRDVEMVTSDGEIVPVQASVLRAGRSVRVEPKGALSSFSRKPRQRVLLQLNEEMVTQGNSCNVAALAQRADFANPGQIATRNSGNPIVHAILLSELSASASREGDRFEAQLAEPVRLGGVMFEAGSLLEGKVTRRQGPRVLGRAGSLYLGFDRVTAPEGHAIAVSGALRSIEAEAGQRFVVEEEGELKGRKPGVKARLVDLGIAYAFGKVTDDIAESPIRAIGAAMSDGAVANAARYFGLGASAAFLILRHGHDVHLPQYAEIEVDFGRRQTQPQD